MVKKIDTICGVFDKQRREELRGHYTLAAHNNQETFTFEGHSYVTGFARYLLEYLDMTLENNHA